jgi:hypothetical protein
MLELLYWMWCSEFLDAWSCGGWGYLLPSTTKVAIGEAAGDGHTGQSGAPPDRHCRLSGAPPCHPTVRVRSSGRSLELCPPAAPDSSVPLWLRCSNFCTTLLLTVAHVRVERCALDSRCPLAHRTVRWIIVERACVFPRVAGLTLYGSGAPDTVRWHIGQSGAPVHSTLKSFLLLLNWVPNLNIYWFVLNLMHL